LCPLSEAGAAVFSVTRASETLPRAAASSGRLRGVFSGDTGDGRWPDLDAIRESVPLDDADALAIGIRITDPFGFAIVIRITDPFGFAIGESLRLPVAVSDRHHSRGDRRPGDGCAEPDT
jgi:hypothetical protein